MFLEHQPKIQAFARRSPDNMAKVLTLAMLSARWPFWRVPEAMADVAKRGHKAEALFGWKHVAWRHLMKHRDAIYEDMEGLYRGAYAEAEAEKMLTLYMAQLPGFGFVKGGFVVQMAYGLSGCLDQWNLERFGYKATEFRARYAKAGRREFHVKRYLEAIHEAGGPAALWDGWCQFMADNEPLIYGSAERVSKLHLKALGLR